MKRLRSYNPALAEYFKASPPPKYQYGYRNIFRPVACQNIIDKLQLKSKYPVEKTVDIIDIFSGYGLFSTMINYELKPRKHIILEGNKENINTWQNRIELLKSKNGNEENFHLYPSDGYTWETYDSLIKKDRIVTPETKDRGDVHNELLIIGNLSTIKFGESLLAQWIMCSVYRNWLHKYGRVRMICTVLESTAHKFLSGPRYSKRNKSAVKRDLFTDTKLIGITEPIDNNNPDSSEYDPNVIFKDQPVLIPSKSVLPDKSSLAVIEIVPKDLSLMDVDLLEYIIQILMYKSTGKLGDALSQIAPGADTDLGPKIPRALQEKTPRDLTAEEFWFIFDLFDKWAFKPTFAETMAITQESPRSF